MRIFDSVAHPLSVCIDQIYLLPVREACPFLLVHERVFQSVCLIISPSQQVTSPSPELVM